MVYSVAETPAPTAFAKWLDGLVPAVFPSDAALARAVGVNRTTVLRWRQGQVPKIPQLLKLSEVTGTSTDTLLRISGYRESG
jgi:transcriptional regulator with XRE-family HTH domain